MYQQLARRLVVDVGLGALVLEQLTADASPEDVLDLVDRLDLIYGVLCPPPRQES